MDVRALIIIGGGLDSSSVCVGGIPLPLVDVLGRPVLHRVVDRLRKHGVQDITIVSDTTLADDSQLGVHCLQSNGADSWRVAQRAITKAADEGAELFVIARVGPYAEVDYQALIESHLENGNRVTAVVHSTGDLAGVFVVNAERRNDAAYLLKHGLNISRLPYSVYEFRGYMNQLDTLADLRRLTIDAFCGNAELRPEGEQIRPGVWTAPTAVIHRSARLVAPCYIGAHARVRAAAVVTRCSAMEHHALVDCGTVLDNATLLPNTSVGAGLDVCNSVVGQKRVMHLGRNLEIEVLDPMLVGTVSPAPVRVLGHLASLASFLPIQFVRGIARKGRPERTPCVADAVQAPSPALKIAAEEQFYDKFVVAKRYGNE